MLHHLKKVALIGAMLPSLALAQTSESQQKTEFIQQYFNQEA